MTKIFEGEEQRAECLKNFGDYVRSKHLKVKGKQRILNMEKSSRHGGAHADMGNGHYQISSLPNAEDMDGITTMACTFDGKKYEWKVDNRDRTLFLEAVEGEQRPQHSLDDIERGRKQKDSWMEGDFTWGIVREGDIVFASVAYKPYAGRCKIHLDTYHWKVGEGVN